MSNRYLTVLKNKLSRMQKVCLGKIFILLRPFLKVNERQILFFTFQGEYTCNPKYICNKIRELDPTVRCIWTVMDRKKHAMPDQVETVRFGSLRYYTALYTSKVLIDNAFNIPKLPVKKKKNQYCIQTMHGSLGIKRIGVESNRTTERNSRGFQSADMTDSIISNSSFEDMVYRTSFWKDTPILQYGHPRNDVLINQREDDQYRNAVKQEICRAFGIDEHIKLAMYAPTFLRDDSRSLEQIDYAVLKDCLQKRFGGEWAIINRLHPRDIRTQRGNSTESYLLNGNSWTDIQELMVAIDFAITDYSSWIFDYVITRKPGIIFAPDLDQYQNSTGFYYPIETAPFPVVRTNQELEHAVLSFDEKRYLKQVEEFLEDKGCIDDGNAAERSAQFVLSLLKGE